MSMKPSDYKSNEIMKVKIQPPTNVYSLGGIMSHSVSSIVYDQEDLGNPISWTRFTPLFSRPKPIPIEDDPFLYDDILDIDFHLDFAESEIPKEFSDLYAKALKESLAPTLCEKFFSFMRPRYLFELGFDVVLFRKWMDTNPRLCISVLKLLIQSDYQQIDQYYNLLLEETMSLAKNEIVSGIAEVLPKNILYEYISMLIRVCDASSSNIRDRNVRLICLLVIQLVKNNLLTKNDPIIEPLKAFTIQNASVKDASNLYQSLDQLYKK